MVEAAYRHHQLLDWRRYINCEIAPDRKFGDAVRKGARAMGWAGFNCSLPHKVAVIQHLDGMARRQPPRSSGAVNCARSAATAEFIGENTDGKGFVQSLERDGRPGRQVRADLQRRRRRRAIGVETALAGRIGRVTVVNRTEGRGLFRRSWSF